MPGPRNRKKSKGTILTIADLLEIPTPVLLKERELILSHLLKIDRSFVIAHPEKTITNAQRRRYEQFLARRQKGEPLAYLFEQQDFFGLNFVVNKHVLIPRPETEQLVSSALQILKEHPEITTIIDVGTGSGSILLSLLKNLPPEERKKRTAYATDISESALAVAKKNARRLKIQNVQWRKGNLLDPLPNIEADVLLLANLPYLPTKDYQATPREVKKFEPREALIAGTDGLKFYRPLLQQMLKQRNVTWYAVWEIDPCHATTILQLVKKEQTLDATINKDFAKQRRYLYFKKRSRRYR